MKKSYKIFIFIFPVFIFLHAISFAQVKAPADTILQFRPTIAGPEYKSSLFHQWLWGSNYRKEWVTPVGVPVMILDTAKGGLIAYKAGGGHQTKSLHLKTADGKEYALRSVNKSLSKVLPESFRHTFIENIANDEIIMIAFSLHSLPDIATKN